LSGERLISPDPKTTQAFAQSPSPMAKSQKGMIDIGEDEKTGLSWFKCRGVGV